jgi:hypothetical protein
LTISTIFRFRWNENESDDRTLSVRDVAAKRLFGFGIVCWWCIVFRAGTEVVFPIFIFPGRM